MISLVLGKIKKGMGISEIADILDMDPDDIKKIVSIYAENPGCSAEEVYEQLSGL